MPLLTVKNLSLSISQHPILKNVSLQIEQGEYLSLVGPNGAGKTSLLKCIMRIIPTWSGSIRLNDKNISEVSQRNLAKTVSYIPQAESQSFPFTVEEFVLLGLYPYLTPFSLYNKDQLAKVSHALHLVDMADFARRSMASLSGGERQKVLIAASLVQDIGLILLDEPTTYLDPKHQIEILHVLQSINNKQGIAMVFVTHDINYAALISHRILGLKNGELVFNGSPVEFMTPEILRQLYDKDFNFMSHPDYKCRITIPDIPPA